MRRFIISLLCLLSSMVNAGELYGYPYIPSNLYDWNYQPTRDVPYTALDGTMTLGATYRWSQGNPGDQITEPQHALMSFSQMVVPTGYFNQTGDQVWTHGVGAFVGEHGLEMELWFRQNDAPNSVVWGQHENRCARDVQGHIPPGTMCLSDVENETGYLTPYPSFVLRKGRTYTVKIKITPTGPGWSKLEAELYQQGIFGTTLIQKGMVGFSHAMFFPLAGEPIKAAIARTPGEPVIQYTVLP